jgi:muconolactone delta-isomerase
VTFLVQGRHGPVDPEEGIAHARAARDYVARLQADGTFAAAWAKAGGGRALVVEAGSRQEVDDLLAAFPGPADTTWDVVEVHDFVAGLDAWLASVGEPPDPA